MTLDLGVGYSLSSSCYYQIVFFYLFVKHISSYAHLNNLAKDLVILVEINRRMFGDSSHEMFHLTLQYLDIKETHNLLVLYQGHALLFTTRPTHDGFFLIFIFVNKIKMKKRMFGDMEKGFGGLL